MAKKEREFATFTGYSWDASYYINGDDSSYYDNKEAKENADNVLAKLKSIYGDFSIVDCTDEPSYALPDYGKQEKGDCVLYSFTYDADYPIYTDDANVSRFTNSVRLESKRDYLPWQKQGLSYTASGYGKKIPTTWKVKFNNRWLRIYSHVFGNSGITFIIVNGKEVLIDDHHLQR